jgi:hypothetical protein
MQEKAVGFLKSSPSPFPHSLPTPTGDSVYSLCALQGANKCECVDLNFLFFFPFYLLEDYFSDVYVFSSFWTSCRISRKARHLLLLTFGTFTLSTEPFPVFYLTWCPQAGHQVINPLGPHVQFKGPPARGKMLF